MDKVFLITGCASGIGKHMGHALSRLGAKVAVTDVNAESLNESFSPGGTLIVLPLDVRAAAQWQAAVDACVERWGRLDVLLNVAGVSHSANLHESDATKIDQHIDINTKGTMYGCRAAARQMLRQGHGHIINIASVAGLVAVPGMSFYSASKFAVRGFSLAIAEELARHNVYVTVICPDAVDTPMLEHEALQPEAALSFAGNKILTVRDLEHAILHHALVRRPREIILPASMNFLARLVTALPELSRWLLPIFSRKGLRRQARYRNRLEKKPPE